MRRIVAWHAGGGFPGLAWLLAVLGAVFPASAQTAADLIRSAHDCFDTLDVETGLRLAGRALDREPGCWSLRLRQAYELDGLGRTQVAWLALERARLDAGKDSKAPEGFGPSALAALWRYREGRLAEARDLAATASRRAKSFLHPERGAKPDWPSAFAPGLRFRADPEEAKRPRRLFIPNAGLASYILGAIAESESGWGGEAEAHFRDALRLSYDAHDCALRIGLGRLAAGDDRGAVQAMLAAGDEGGLHPDYLLVLAAAADAAGDGPAAADRLALAIDLRPYEPIWLRGLAAMSAASGHPAEAMSLLNRALRLNPADMRGRDLLDDLEKGRRLPERAFGDALAESLAALRRRLEPRWTDALWRAPDAAARINARFGRYLGEGLVDDAARLLRAFLRRDADSPTLLYNLAQLESSLGRPAEALPAAWDAAARKPDYLNALDAAGRQLFVLGDYGRAVLLYEDALAGSPRDPLAWFNLACARHGRGDAAGAEADLQQALDLDRLSERILEGSDDKAAPQAGSGGTAHDLTVAVESVRYRALVLRGVLRRESGDLAAARSAVAEAVTLQPASPEAHLEMGRILLAAGEPSAAEAALARYVELGGSPAQARSVRQAGTGLSVRTP
jgi:tetratricopeptide (TPR) repeat protein